MGTFLKQALAVVGGKGGVGKSTWAAELAHVAATEHGWKVLLIEADPQGNQWRQFGVEKSDGSAMLQALLTGSPLPRIAARPNLDISLCGEAVFDLIREVDRQAVIATLDPKQNPITAKQAWERALVPIADGYNLIVFDTPPGEKHLVESVLAVCSSVVGTTTVYDEAAIDGLEIVYARMDACDNPHLQLLGVGLFGVSKLKGHKQFEDNARESLTKMMDGDSTVFDSTIRLNLNAASDHRAYSLLSAELELEAKATKTKTLQRLTAKRKAKRTGGAIDIRDSNTPRTSLAVASDLAAEHYNLSSEVLEAFTAHLETIGA